MDHLLLRLSLLVGVTECFSRGAPTSQCEYMTPKHGFQPQNSLTDEASGQPRFRLEVGCRHAAAGDDVLVSLVSGGGMFKGFLLRAENATVKEPRSGGTRKFEAKGRFGSPNMK